jgi:hypothetical protein
METSAKLVGWFVEPKLLSATPITGKDFFQNHKRVLESQKQFLSKLETFKVCLACLLGIPTEFLGCGHVLCGQCCQELFVGGLIECPFCDYKGEWKREDIPYGAGIRVLNIDGEGVQGLSTAVLLQKIEELFLTNNFLIYFNSQEHQIKCCHV